ncbi:hypothetical protein PR003_g16686 [Phytophthora rubi]|uniref:Uncharacterized protein n=1 Tax=Phytophthora rubi TaxID=129364 RepID=A0A6A4EWW9_9STRA|nr:hypothetical protein PR003_g16686 [Phytophthora rubi]
MRATPLLTTRGNPVELYIDRAPVSKEPHTEEQELDVYKLHAKEPYDDEQEQGVDKLHAWEQDDDEHHVDELHADKLNAEELHADKHP